MKEVNFDSGKDLLLRWTLTKNILPKEIFWEDVRGKIRQMIKELLKYSLNKELETILEAERYQHTELREGYRSYYRRSFLVGGIDNFLVSRARKKVKFRLLERYKRRLNEFDYTILNCFLNGYSTIKTAQFFYSFFSKSNISHQTVSNILKRLDNLVN